MNDRLKHTQHIHTHRRGPLTHSSSIFSTNNVTITLKCDISLDLHTHKLFKVLQHGGFIEI